MSSLIPMSKVTLPFLESCKSFPPISSSSTKPTKFNASCTSIDQPHDSITSSGEASILCEPCSGRGWILCDFCKGQKINVKAENKRIYRRCPSCRAIGVILCSKCMVFKCVTFPDFSDSAELPL